MNDPYMIVAVVCLCLLCLFIGAVLGYDKGWRDAIVHMVVNHHVKEKEYPLEDVSSLEEGSPPQKTAK